MQISTKGKIFGSLAVAAALTAFTFAPMGGKVIHKSGKLLEFKTHKDMNFTVSYESMRLGDYNSEAEYTDKKVKDLNKKEKGKGDTWLEKWENAKAVVWPGRFEQLYNKILGEKLGYKIHFGDTSYEYTLAVKVTFLEPGFNIGIMKRIAEASFSYTLLNEKGEELAELYCNNVPGADAMGMDFDTDKRVGESFAKAGKSLAAFIVKKAK